MNDFLEFSELMTDRVVVQDAEGRAHRMFSMQVIALRPLGHPAGERAELPAVHISEHQLQDFLEALASKVRQYFPASSEPGSSGSDSGKRTRH